MAWTSTSDRVLAIFTAISGVDDKIARTIFGRIRSDKMQRDMTLDVAKLQLAERPALLAGLTAALRELEQLSSDRNIFAHVSFGVHFDRDWNPSIKTATINKMAD